MNKQFNIADDMQGTVSESHGHFMLNVFGFDGAKHYSDTALLKIFKYQSEIRKLMTENPVTNGTAEALSVTSELSKNSAKFDNSQLSQNEIIQYLLSVGMSDKEALNFVNDKDAIKAAKEYYASQRVNAPLSFQEALARAKQNKELASAPASVPSTAHATKKNKRTIPASGALSQLIDSMQASVKETKAEQVKHESDTKLAKMESDKQAKKAARLAELQQELAELQADGQKASESLASTGETIKAKGTGTGIPISFVVKVVEKDTAQEKEFQALSFDDAYDKVLLGKRLRRTSVKNGTVVHDDRLIVERPFGTTSGNHYFTEKMKQGFIYNVINLKTGIPVVLKRKEIAA